MCSIISNESVQYYGRGVARNKRMKLAPRATPETQRFSRSRKWRRGRRVSRAVQGTPHATAWRRLSASR